MTSAFGTALGNEQQRMPKLSGELNFSDTKIGFPPPPSHEVSFARHKTLPPSGGRKGGPPPKSPCCHHHPHRTSVRFLRSSHRAVTHRRRRAWSEPPPDVRMCSCFVPAHVLRRRAAGIWSSSTLASLCTQRHPPKNSVLGTLDAPKE